MKTEGKCNESVNNEFKKRLQHKSCKISIIKKLLGDSYICRPFLFHFLLNVS